MGPDDGAPSIPANPTLHNPPWDRARLRALVVRLSPFDIAERSSTHLFLAHATRRGEAEAFVDLLFVPQRREDGAPAPPLSLEARQSPRQFDLLLLSNSYLLELLNVPLLLRGSGIPLESEDRGDDDPVILLGGANASAAHALARRDEATGAWASMVDAFFFGEGEGEVERLIAVYAAHRLSGRNRVLDAMCREVPALWAPALGGEAGERRPRKAVCRSFGLQDVATDGPVLPGAEASTARLQITYGCPALCSFCFESYDRRPYREVPAALLLEAARALKRASGAERLELFSFNFSYHTEFPDLLMRLTRLYGEVSVMSQRVDVLAANPGLLDFEIAAGKRTYTLGVEGVSSRIRGFLQKGLGTAEIEQVADELVNRRVRELKLSYIVTGYEEERDVAELDGFLSRLERARAGAPVPRLIVSFTYLLRMPFTPLWLDPPLLERTRAEAIVASLRRIVQARAMEFRLAGSWEEHVASQLLVSAGHAARDLLEALADAGVAYTGGLPERAWPIVRRWMEGRGDLVREISRGQASGAAPPFAFLHGSPEGPHLAARYREALQALSGSVEERPLRFTRSHAEPDVRGMERIMRERTEAERRAVYAEVDLPRETADNGAAWRNSWIMREVFRADPGLVDLILRVEEIGVSRATGAPERFWGRGIARVVGWEPGAIEARLLRGLPPFARLVQPPRPEGYREIEVRLQLAGLTTRDAGAALAEFLRATRCAAVTARQGAAYVSTPSAATRRRRSFLGARLEGSPRGATLLVRGGRRLELAALLAALETPYGEPVAEVTCLEL